MTTRFGTVLWLLAILCPLGFAQAAEAPPFPDELLARVGQSVVIIERFDADGGYMGPAAAFLAEPGRLVTNRHCVEGASRIEVNLGPLGLFTAVAIVVDAPELDVVVLETDIPAGTLPLLPLAEEAVERGTPLAVVVRDLMGEVTASPGVAVTEAERYGPGTLFTSAPAWRGCSGAPLIDHHGRVVGIVNRLDHGPAEATTARAAPAHLVTSAPSRDPRTVSEWWAAQEVANGCAARRLARAGEGLAHRRRPAAALEVYRRAVALAPGQRDAVIGMAYTLSDLGRSNEAEKVLREYLAHAPKDAAAWLDLARVQLRAKQFTGAAASLERSLAIQKDPAALFQLGSAYAGVGNLDKAAQAWEEAVALNPFDVASLTELYVVYRCKDRLADLMRVQERLVEADPQERRWVESLASSYARAGRVEKLGPIAEGLGEARPYESNRVRSMMRR